MFLADECGVDLSKHAHGFICAGIHTMSLLEKAIFHRDEKFLRRFLRKHRAVISLTHYEGEMFMTACNLRRSATRQ